MSYLIDPELAALLADLEPGNFSDLTAERAAFGRSRRLAPSSVPPAVLEQQDLEVSHVGGRLGLRVYRPVAPRAERRPALLYVHGGGFVLGGLEVTDGLCRAYASQLEAVVVAPDYRLAPEHPYPAALDDCQVAWDWLRHNADDLSIDAARIAVAGESAGGCLAAALALRLADARSGRIRGLLLDIPVLDDRCSTPSMTEFVDTPIWFRANAELSWSWYLQPGFAPGGPDVPGTAAPARADDLSGLPPTRLAIAEYDPLRDEALDFGRRLLAAGVSTSISLYAGAFHGSAMFADATLSTRMWRDDAEFLDSILHDQTRQETVLCAR